MSHQPELTFNSVTELLEQIKNLEVELFQVFYSLVSRFNVICLLT